MGAKFNYDLIKDLNIPFVLSCFDSITNNVILLSNLLTIITEELDKFYDLGSTVSSIKDESEAMTLYIDISGFLRELGCPYMVLNEGPLELRFSSESNIELLLTFLLTELAAAKINAVQRPNSCVLAKPQVVTAESNTNLTAILKPALKALGVGPPPDNMTEKMLFDKMEKLLKEKLPIVPKYFLGKSLFSEIKSLNEEQWQQVESMINSHNDALNNQRQTLIQRFDVTVQSFQWSPQATKVMDQIVKVHAATKLEIDSYTPITLVDVLAARDFPLTVVEKTCGAKAREKTKCPLNRLLIGSVPDRGGRSSEMEPPPPELPAFQKRDNSGQPNSRGRGGGFQNQDRGGRQNQGGSGGYQQQGMNRNSQYSQGDQQYRGSFDNRSQGRHVIGNQVTVYSQSVGDYNYHNQNMSAETFQPQFQRGGSHQQSNYGGQDWNDGRRRGRY